MSSFPRNDLQHRDDNFNDINNAGDNITQTSYHEHRQIHPSPPVMHWSNQLLSAPPILQHHAMHHTHYYNMSTHRYTTPSSIPTTAIPSTSGQQDSYSVLRMGHGSFFKFYHSSDNALSPISLDNQYAIYQGSYNNQQQLPNLQTNYLHMSQQQHSSVQQEQEPQTQSISDSTTSNSFNSYELFSSNTFTHLHNLEVPSRMSIDDPNNDIVRKLECDLNSTSNIISSSSGSITTNTATMIINELVNNWSPNVANDINAQFESKQKHLHQKEFSAQEYNIQNSFGINEIKDSFTNDTTTNNNIVDVGLVLINDQVKEEKTNVTNPVITNNKLDNSTHNPKDVALKEEILPKEILKKIAEIKPIRMSYSEVLSNLNGRKLQEQQISTTSHKFQQCPTNMQNNKINQKINKNDISNNISSGNSIPTLNTSNSNGNRRSGEENVIQIRPSKKSPLHENKENTQSSICSNNNKVSSTGARSIPMINNKIQIQKNSFNVKDQSNGNKKSITNTKKVSDLYGESNFHILQTYEELSETSSRNKGNTTVNVSLSSPTNAKSMCSSSRKSIPKYSSTNNYSYSSISGSQHRSRSQNVSNSSYSYSSTKRGRNSHTISSSSNLSYSTDSHKRKYELLMRFMHAWYNYTIKILTWLFYLIYDIVYLGCSMLYDHFLQTINSGHIYIKKFLRDMKQNSYKPGLWLKIIWQRFDGFFNKTSKWAFWRCFYKKKSLENIQESFKSCRLPQTGEEAMYSLLNCKGKDAYSILGVPTNCSQEQIRKHYKKIAVLVHPDKNKQPGAEEAFKVLQRAFELIGEPENRVSYDQNLAEALHAEKTWTELHDLLSQLQTKITEAANTIRCSTCVSRHPRKLTDRRHYAARECASCKIRHSAREGDIWAETGIFGFRWRYLALMDGKVYDITEWANCQKGALAHLEPNSHVVQYRIVRGAQQQQQQRQQQKQHTRYSNSMPSSSHCGSVNNSCNTGSNSGKYGRDMSASQTSLHDFLDNLYSGQHPRQQQANSSTYTGSTRRRNRRN